jgi:hypothetical protein
MAAGRRVVRGAGPRRRVVPTASTVFAFVRFRAENTGVDAVRHFAAAIHPTLIDPFVICGTAIPTVKGLAL